MSNRLHDELLQHTERMGMKSIEDEQDCHTDIAHDSCSDDYLSSSDNADSIPGETQHSEKKVEYRTISENGGNSSSNSDNLENQISSLQCELNDMRSDRYVMFGHDMTWKEHLEWTLQILTESQSVDRGPGSGQEKPSKRHAAKYRVIVVAFAYELMGKEQERQNDNQKLLEEVLLWLKKVPRDSESGRFKTATDLFSRAKLVLKKDRECLVR